MLPLKSQLLVSTAAALVSWQRQTKAPVPEPDRPAPHAYRAVASLHFVHFVGFWSQFAWQNQCSAWPLPRAEAIEELTYFAEEQRVLASQPLPGDVFLLGSVTGDRQVRAGVLSGVEPAETLLCGNQEWVCTTIEGELHAGSADDAPRVTGHFATRRLSLAYGDQFIRWWELPEQALRAGVVHVIPDNLITFNLAKLRSAA